MNRNTVSKKIKILVKLGFLNIIKSTHKTNICNGYILSYPRTIDLVGDEVCNKYYIYAHVFNNEIIYVGKGSKSRSTNFTDRNKDYIEFINNVGKDNIDVLIIKDFENELDAYEYEKNIIEYYKENGQCRFNMIIGHPTLNVINSKE